MYKRFRYYLTKQTVTVRRVGLLLVEVLRTKHMQQLPTRLHFAYV